METVCRLSFSLLSVALLVFFFVRVPPLGWLGGIVIVLFFVLRATLWLVRGYYYRFVTITECVSLFFGVCVFNVLRGGVRFPNEVGIW